MMFVWHVLPLRCSSLEAHQWCRSTGSRCWQRRRHGIPGLSPENTTKTHSLATRGSWDEFDKIFPTSAANEAHLSLSYTNSSLEEKLLQETSAEPESQSPDNRWNKYSQVLRMFSFFFNDVHWSSTLKHFSAVDLQYLPTTPRQDTVQLWALVRH